MHRGGDRFAGVTSFAPRFDIRETEDAYHLEGELPGLTQQDIEIEFSDPQTLLIKGHTERTYSSGTPPTEVQSAADSTTTSTSSSAETSGEQPAVATENNNTTTDSSRTDVLEQAEQTAVDSPHGRYWVTERSYGEFSRTFSFPSRIDQDAVKANLKNGLLSIVVPKAAAPAAKRINIA